jgi:hypothetical protein
MIIEILLVKGMVGLAFYVYSLKKKAKNIRKGHKHTPKKLR